MGVVAAVISISVPQPYVSRDTSGVVSSTGSTTTTYHYRDVYKTLTKTPKPWPKKLFPLPYTYRYTTYTAGLNGLLKTKDSTGWTMEKFGCLSNVAPGQWGLPQLGVPVAPVLQAEAESNAITKARLKIQDQKFNLAQAFAEREQTIALIGETAATLANAIRHLKKGNFLGARRALGNPRLRRKLPSKGLDKTSRQWLSLQYGWQPLLGDVFNACEAGALFDKENPAAYLIDVKGSFWLPSDINDKTTVNLQPWVTSNGQKVVQWTGGEGRAGAICKIWYTVSNSILANQTAMGLTNPAYLAWELLPFSFVADWFMPVGAYLNSMGATFGCTFYKGFSTYYHLYEISRIYTVDRKMGSYGIDRLEGYTEHIRGAAGSRQIYGDFPIGRRPYFKNPFSNKHALNALALLNQACKK